MLKWYTFASWERFHHRLYSFLFSKSFVDIDYKGYLNFCHKILLLNQSFVSLRVTVFSSKGASCNWISGKTLTVINKQNRCNSAFDLISKSGFKALN